MEPWYLGLLRFDHVVITTILPPISSILIILSTISVVLFRGSNLRVHFSFSPIKKYILTKLAGFKVGGIFSINVTTDLSD